MPPLTDHSDLVDIKVMLGKLTVEMTNTAAKVSDIDRKLDTYVTRREAETSNGAIEERIHKLEKSQEKAVWAIVLSWITGISAVIGKKTGIIP